MTFKEFQAILASIGGTCRTYTFDSGYRLYATVYGDTISAAHEWGDEMRNDYLYPEDRLYQTLVASGALPRKDFTS